MKYQLLPDEQRSYELLLAHFRASLNFKFGTQKSAATYLGVDHTYLSKVLSGVIDMNSKLFYKIWIVSDLYGIKK